MRSPTKLLQLPCFFLLSVFLTCFSSGVTATGIEAYVIASDGVAADEPNFIFKNLVRAFTQIPLDASYDSTQDVTIFFDRDSHFVTSDMLPASWDWDVDSPAISSIPSFFEDLTNPSVTLKALSCVDQSALPVSIRPLCSPESDSSISLNLKIPSFHFRFFQQLTIEDVDIDGSDLMIWQNCADELGPSGECCETEINSLGTCCSASKMEENGACQPCQFFDSGFCPSASSLSNTFPHPKSHFHKGIPLFIFDSSLNPDSSSSDTPSLNLENVTVKNFTHQISSIINFKTPGSLSLSDCLFENISTTAGVVTSNFDTLVAASASSASSLYSLGHWANDSLLQDTLAISSDHSSDEYSISIAMSSFSAINTVSLPRSNDGVEIQFFSTNASIFRFFDFRGTIAISDSTFEKHYCDLLMNETNMAGRMDDHIGGGVFIVYGQSMTITLHDTTIRDVMSARGAIQIENTAGSSSLEIIDSEIVRAHGLSVSVLKVTSSTDMPITITGTTLRNNILSSNRTFDSVYVSSMMIINLPLGSDDTPAITLTDCDIEQNYGIGETILAKTNGSSLKIHDSRLNDNGNMLYTKYQYSYYTTVFPTANIPKSSGKSIGMFLTSDVWDVHFTECEIKRNWTMRSSTTTILHKMGRFFNNFKFNDNVVEDIRGQFELGETDEWGYVDGQLDSEPNHNWLPKSATRGQPGLIMTSLWVGSSSHLSSEFHRNVFKNIFLDESGQFYIFSASGTNGSILYQTATFHDNQLINFAVTAPSNGMKYAVFFPGVKKTDFRRNLVDNMEWMNALAGDNEANFPYMDEFAAYWGLGQFLGSAFDGLVEGVIVQDDVFRGCRVREAMIKLYVPVSPNFIRSVTFDNCHCSRCPMVQIHLGTDLTVLDDIKIQNSSGQLVSTSQTTAPLPPVVIMNSNFVAHDMGGIEFISSSLPAVLLINNAFIGNFNSAGPVVRVSQQSSFEFWFRSYSNIFLFHTDERNDGIYDLANGEFRDVNSLYVGNIASSRGGVYRATSGVTMYIEDNRFIGNAARDNAGVIFGSSGTVVHSTNNLYERNGVVQTNLSLIDEVAPWSFSGSEEIFLSLWDQITQFSVYKDDLPDYIRNHMSEFSSFSDRQAVNVREEIINDFLNMDHSSTYFGDGSWVLNGGVLGLSTQSYVLSDSDEYKENKGTEGSMLQCASSDEVVSVIKNGQILGHDAVLSTLKLLNCKATLDNSELRRNTATSITAGAFLLSSTFTAIDSVFSDQEGEEISAFISAGTLSKVDLTRSQFLNGRGSRGGAIILAIASELKADDCEFTNNSAGIGGAIYSTRTQRISLKNSRFFGNSGTRETSTLYVTRSENVEISENSIIRSSANHEGVIKILDTTSVTLDTAMIESSASTTDVDIDDLLQDFQVTSPGSNVSHPSGVHPAISLLRVASVTMNKFICQNYNHQGGPGAILVDSTRLDESLKDGSTVTISQSAFAQNSGGDNGGALRLISVPTTTITDTMFIENHSHSNSGGAVFYECPSEECTWTLGSGLEFDGNTAFAQGGAVSWRHVKPATAANITNKNNEASYGPNLAGIPSAVVFIDDPEAESVEDLPDPRDMNDWEAPTRFTDFRSGTTLEEPILLALVDNYGQVVKTDSTSIAEIRLISSDENGTVLNARQKAENGIFTFDSLYFRLKPETTGEYQIETSTLADSTFPDKFMQFKISFRACQRGEIQTQDDECHVCGSELNPQDPGYQKDHMYSLSTKDTECSACPSEAYCWGRDKMAPRKGYWRANEDSLEFIKCPNEEACLGATPGDNADFPSGQCNSDDGYEGPLCTGCRKGYTSGARSTCTECPDLWLTLLRLIILLALAALVIGLIVRNTLKSAKLAESERSHLNVYMRIFTNYIQMVTMTATIEMNWPDEFKELFFLQDQIGAISDRVFSLDCFFETDDALKYVFINVLLTNLLPIILFVVALIFWMFYLLFHRKSSILTELESTVVIIFFLVHPSIMKTNLAFFSCRDLGDGKHLLIPDLSVECWSSEHMQWIYSVVLPGIAVWVIGAPATAITILIRNRKKMDNLDVRAKYGFLYSGYKPELFYWEAFTLLRKFCIACLVVFLSVAVDRSLQALICFAILGVAYILQQRYRPYSERPLNLLETNSIIVATMTIYCGLYFVNDELSKSSQLALFFFLLFCNLYFVLYWIFKIGDKLPAVIQKKYPKLFDRCLKLRYHRHPKNHRYELANLNSRLSQSMHEEH